MKPVLYVGQRVILCGAPFRIKSVGQDIVTLARAPGVRIVRSKKVDELEDEA